MTNFDTLKAGKLPWGLLDDLLSDHGITDPRVILGTKMGEDAALIDFGNRYLVTKTDPITFATDLIGWYLVHNFTQNCAKAVDILKSLAPVCPLIDTGWGVVTRKTSPTLIKSSYYNRVINSNDN